MFNNFFFTNFELGALRAENGPTFLEFRPKVLKYDPALFKYNYLNISYEFSPKMAVKGRNCCKVWYIDKLLKMTYMRRPIHDVFSKSFGKNYQSFTFSMTYFSF